MQKTQWRSRTSSRKFWWLDNSRSQGPKRQLRISKQSSICSRGTGSSYSMDPGESVKKENFTRNPEKLAKVPGTREETISLFSDNSLEFGKACEDLSWNHCTSTPHRSETYGIAGRAVRRVKEGTSAVLLQSGLNESWVGQILWNVTPICETSQIYYLMGRRPMKDVLGNHLKDLLFHLVHWLSIILWLRRISHESINLERKFYLDCSSDTLFTRGGIWKGDVLIADLEELETMDASEIYSKRLNAKEVIFPKEGEFTFPIADGRIKTPGEDQELRISTLIRPRPSRGEGHVDFLGESEGSFPQPHDSLPRCRWTNERLLVHVGKLHIPPSLNLETNFTRREKNHSLFHWSKFDVSRTTHTNLDVKQEKRIDDYWNLDGSRNLSDPWTGFTQFTLLDEKAPDGYTWSVGGTNEKTAYIQARSSMARIMEVNGKERQAEGKSKNGLKKRFILTTHENLRGIYFIDPEDKEFKETIKNARKKLETSDKTCVYSGSQWIHQNAYGELWISKSRRPYCMKRWKFITALQLGSQIYSYASKLWKFLQRKQRWTRNGKNSRKFRRGTWQKSQVRKMWSMKQGCWAPQFILHH